MTSPLRTGTNPVHVEGDPRLLLRLRRMARELRLTDQILSFDLDCVTLVEGSPVGAPAWTAPDGETITFDVSRMPKLNEKATRRDIAVWLGTNAHELFHNLFTPRSSSMLMRRIEAANNSTLSGIHRSWNILEDQRIERLGLARFYAWRGYLVAALAHHIPVTHPGAWVLVAGRTWLGDEVRAIARAAFVATNGDAAAQRAAELIGDYQRLVDPGDDDAAEAYAIVDEFHRLFGSQLPPKGGCGSGRLDEGEPEPGDEATGCPIPAADEVDDEPESDEGEGDDDGEASDDDGESDEGDESDDDDFGDDGSGKGDDDTEGDDDEGDESDDDEGDEGEGQSDKPGEGEPGDGCSAPDGERHISEALDEAIDEALSEDDTATDLDRVVDQVAHGAPGRGDLPRSTGEWLDATGEARLLARDVSQVLADIKDDNEAAWVRHTDTGRFSVARWATDPNWDADTVFDEFQPGAMDASSLDVVLVLDVSGSMKSQIHRLAEATWAIRQAVDRVEGTCTVIGFGDDATMIFDTGARPDGRMFIPHLENSTNPTPACREAHRIVNGSTAANRIVILLTDGDFWDAATAEASLRACQAEGAITCVVGLGTHARVRPGFMGADVAERIYDSAELVPIFRSLAERSMLAAAGRR